MRAAFAFLMIAMAVPLGAQPVIRPVAEAANSSGFHPVEMAAPDCRGYFI